MTYSYQQGKQMLWIRTETGDWMNLEKATSIFVDQRHVSVKILYGLEEYIWRKFDNCEEAQSFLDTQMQVLTGV